MRTTGATPPITGGFVYHGSQFPGSYEGGYFFADYTQNWIKCLTFDANGNVNGVFNFEPLDGSVDGPYGDIVYLTEGPDGALYYVDLGYSDISGTFGVSKIRRIRYLQSEPGSDRSGLRRTPTSGAAPLTVNFSSAGSPIPKGSRSRYSWTFGDGTTSTAANPSHTYAQAGPIHGAAVRLRRRQHDHLDADRRSGSAIRRRRRSSLRQDGITFSGGRRDLLRRQPRPTRKTARCLRAPTPGTSTSCTRVTCIPGIPQTGVKSGTFTIPTAGHDFSGNTRYRVTLTVTDSDGLTSTTSVIVWPQKVNLTFDTVPPGLTLYLDGIAKVTPFVYDTLIGFNHTIEARNQSSGTTNYTFSSWSDGGAQQHTIVVPAHRPGYTATYSAVSPPATPAFVQVASSTPQTRRRRSRPSSARHRRPAT